MKSEKYTLTLLIGKGLNQKIKIDVLGKTAPEQMNNFTKAITSSAKIRFCRPG